MVVGWYVTPKAKYEIYFVLKGASVDLLFKTVKNSVHRRAVCQSADLRALVSSLSLSDRLTKSPRDVNTVNTYIIRLTPTFLGDHTVQTLSDNCKCKSLSRFVKYYYYLGVLSLSAHHLKYTGLNLRTTNINMILPSQ